MDTIFKPGSRPRTTDVIFETKDIYPFRVFAGYDNYGSKATNEHQTYLGFSYGDLWDADHELVYSFGSSIDFNFVNMSLTAVGSATTKKEAMHMAAKKVLEKMDVVLQGNM